MLVLVTGGAGYIGSHAAKALAMGWPRAYGSGQCRLPGIAGQSSGGRSLNGTSRIRKVSALSSKRNGWRPSWSLPQVCWWASPSRSPRKYFWNNVVNTLRLLDVMLRGGNAGISFLLFGSHLRQSPEGAESGESPKEPVNPYGETKLAMERALQWYGNAYEMRWVALRYFNAAGADPDGELGESHDPEAHLIPFTIEAALGHRPYVEIYGTDYPTPDGTAIRDYIHVTDLADAHVRALRIPGRGQRRPLR